MIDVEEARALYFVQDLRDYCDSILKELREAEGDPETTFQHTSFLPATP